MKIAIFGDSISEGIGKRKINFCSYLKTLLSISCNEVCIDNYARTGTTIHYLSNILNQSLDRYDIAVIGYGNVDAMLRPDRDHLPNYYNYLPSRYKQNGMLNPRPYYSTRWYKKIVQHCDSFIRITLNKILLNLQGACTWVSISEFYDEYLQCVRTLKKSGCANVILLSTVHVGDKYFPGTNDEYIKFNDSIRKIAGQEKCAFIDLFSLMRDEKYFYEDLFHPNAEGYNKIAELINEALKLEK